MGACEELAFSGAPAAPALPAPPPRALRGPGEALLSPASCSVRATHSARHLRATACVRKVSALVASEGAAVNASRAAALFEAKRDLLVPRLGFDRRCAASRSRSGDTLL